MAAAPVIIRVGPEALVCLVDDDVVVPLEVGLDICGVEPPVRTQAAAVFDLIMKKSNNIKAEKMQSNIPTSDNRRNKFGVKYFNFYSAQHVPVLIFQQNFNSRKKLRYRVFVNTPN